MSLSSIKELLSKSERVRNSYINTAYNYDVFGGLKLAGNVTYQIDPLQRRNAKLVNNIVVKKYAYNPEGQMIAELDAQGNLLKTFIYATKAHVPDYFIDQSNVLFKLVVDHLGSVRFIVKASTGEIVQKMNHDEFGKVLEDSNPGFTPFGFAGGIYDSETKLVRFGARDYNSETGRWLSKDPIRFSGGDSNLYGYVMADPINGIDPSGLITANEFWGGMSILGGGLQTALGGGVVIAGGAVAVAGGAALAGPTLGIGLVPGLTFAYFVTSNSNTLGSNLVNSGSRNLISGMEQIRGPINTPNQCGGK